MYIGLGIVLLVIGAIIQFAYKGDDLIGGVLSVNALGWIMIVAGVAAILLSFALRGTARRTGYTSTRESTIDPNTGSRVDRTDVDPH
ncbi:MAG: DUF6458 family protein [Actinomycetia bacterium]|nr:DUF6458 family protein [Actinomycetes bacterium]